MLIVCTLHERQGSDDLVARSAFTTCFRANIAYEVMNYKPPTDLRARYLGIFGAYRVSRVVLHRHLPIYKVLDRHRGIRLCRAMIARTILERVNFTMQLKLSKVLVPSSTGLCPGMRSGVITQRAT